MLSDFLRISPRIHVLPLVHGSGDFAVVVRRVMLAHSFDCIAVPLPPSFQQDVEAAVLRLPEISMVAQPEPLQFSTDSWDDDEPDTPQTYSYVPIDPCQGVIAAIRCGLEERIPRAFIDLETAHFQSTPSVFPDPYALKRVSPDAFAAAVLPAIPRLPAGQSTDRVVAMAARLKELERNFSSILLVCSLTDWPWIREAYHEQTPQTVPDDTVEPTVTYSVDPNTLAFFLGELPFITALYELARAELDEDDNLSVDGVKELLLEARDRYRAELKSRARKITPKLLATYFRYVRNLALVERRLTPDLYTLVTAAQQIAGDQFAVHVAETARDYFALLNSTAPFVRMSVDMCQLPDGDVVNAVSRLPGHPVEWRTCSLNRRLPPEESQYWQMQWNPFRQCSWPPEDVAIEKFRTHVKDAALSLLGNDLARSEKFSTSLKDGLDIRETLRNWHTGDLYVKIIPPSRGNLDCVLMFFDAPADPRDYPWRTTWHAEHQNESTLALFASDFRNEMVGPGIGVSTYGGAMFLFPPRPIPDVWQDPRFDFTDTLEERLLAAACHHSRERHIAVLSSAPPGRGWQRLAKHYGRKLVHVPLGRFSQATIQQLKLVHVLNGQEIRSFAAHYIRKA